MLKDQLGTWFSHKTWLGTCASGEDGTCGSNHWRHFKGRASRFCCWESPKYLAGVTGRMELSWGMQGLVWEGKWLFDIQVELLGWKSGGSGEVQAEDTNSRVIGVQMVFLWFYQWNGVNPGMV